MARNVMVCWNEIISDTALINYSSQYNLPDLIEHTIRFTKVAHLVIVDDMKHLLSNVNRHRQCPNTSHSN